MIDEKNLIHILIVEDDPVFRELLKSTLESESYKVLISKSIHEAMKEIYNKNVDLDLCLIDFKLPDGNGISLISEIKKIRSDLPIIGLTDQYSKKIKVSAMLNGANDVIEKSVVLGEKFKSTIKKSLNPAILKKENINLNQQIIHNSRLTALGELAATVVHDIKGPLTLIKSICEDLDESIKSNHEIDINELSNFIKKIEKSSSKIETLVDHLKNYSRKDMNEKEELRSINMIIEDSLFLTQQKIKKNQINVEKKISSELLKSEIICQPNKFEQVIVNLISNACDAMKNKEKRILSIEVYQDYEKVIIKISDTGSGIPSNIRPKIFESFFTTKPKGEGTGLGLSIVKNIVKEHDGTLLFDSTEDQGTSFYIQLPLTRLQIGAAEVA